MKNIADNVRDSDQLPNLAELPELELEEVSGGRAFPTDILVGIILPVLLGFLID